MPYHTGLQRKDAHMNAVIWTRYGPPESLQLDELPLPAVGAREVLIRVHAATVTAGDCEMRSLRLPAFLGLPMRMYAGFRHPRRIRVLGQELAGVVESTGSAVHELAVGDAVFGSPGMRLGGYAEYVSLSMDSEETVLARKPENISFAEVAASTVGGLEALHFLRRAGLSRGDALLVNGAGGSIGTFAVQLAKHEGLEVTAVDATEKLGALRELGADHVIDYTREDFSEGGTRYDAVLDMVGGASFTRCMRALKADGRYLMANPSVGNMLRGKLMTLFGGKRVIGGAGRQRSEDLEHIAQLLEGKSVRTVIDRRFPLEDIVEAHRYAETGRKTGNILITVRDEAANTRISST